MQRNSRKREPHTRWKRWNVTFTLGIDKGRRLQYTHSCLDDQPDILIGAETSNFGVGLKDKLLENEHIF